MKRRCEECIKERYLLVDGLIRIERVEFGRIVDEERVERLEIDTRAYDRTDEEVDEGTMILEAHAAANVEAVVVEFRAASLA